ncbi:MAG: hypothetical protein A3G76_01630 [Acidobacteria bacterium RIFCSPLOWO2_12_FULL_65_11]|nr:MAG: hypothetical protein A3G76_01630 [Acidobacteria bacterium RIFCSPLOWO2_12_FULL_65_11]
MTAIVLAAVGVLWRGRGSDVRPARPNQHVVALPQGATFAANPAGFAVSPDGAEIAMTLRLADRVEVWTWRLATLEARPLAGTDGATSLPAWSPDGKSIAFVSGAKLRRVLAAGGPAETIVDLDADAVFDWGVDDTLLVAARGEPIRRVAAAGGATIRQVTHPISGDQHEAPRFVPGARLFLFFVRSDVAFRQGLWLAALDGGNALKLVPQAGTGAVTGEFLVYSVDRSVMAQRFDTTAAALYGMPVALADHVRLDAASHRPAYSVSVAGDVLAFQNDSDGALHVLSDWSTLVPEK